MTQEELQAYHEHSFDAFCKKIIKHAAADAHRESKRRRNSEIDIDDPVIEFLHSLHTKDTYTTYCKIFLVRGIEVPVKDEQIAEALQYLMPNKRAVVLLSFFGDYSDTEIAAILGVANSTVNARKKAGLNRLRELLEVRYNG